MPLPLRLEFGGKRVAQTIVLAQGPKRDFAMPLPSAPKKVSLDPDLWVLSRETLTKKLKALTARPSRPRVCSGLP